MPVLYNATLIEVRAAGGTDQSEGTGAGAVLWAGEALAYWRENARAVATAGGSGVLSTRVLYVDRALGLDWQVGHVARFVTRSGRTIAVRVLEVVGTEAPPGLPAAIDTVKLLAGNPVT